MRRSFIALTTAFGLLASVTAAGVAADRSVLWQVISNLCVRGEQDAGARFPCLYVDPKRGFALLKTGRSHFLLIPTVRIEGIESPELLTPGAPNFWEYAWEARDRLDDATGVHLSIDEVGLAVNSAQARTQDQLHIHIGCIRPDVRAALEAHEADFGENWSRLPFALVGHEYWAMRIVGDVLEPANPFELLAGGIPAARHDMAGETLVVTGARFRDGRNGFYVLADQSRGKYAATGERLLDYQCTVALASR